LEAALQWLWRNPSTPETLAGRRKRFAVLQAAADGLSPEDWQGYVKSWDKEEQRSAAERHGILHALAYARRHAIAEFRRTRVHRGMVAWHVYNIGFLVRTSTAAFGIDLHGAALEQLAHDLDFLLSTHEHSDHNSLPLMQNMAARGKPVLSRHFVEGRIVREPGEFDLAGIRINVDLGDHHMESPGSKNDMLMYCIDAGEDGAIYHAGDCNNREKIKPARPVDLLIFHLEVGLNIADVLERVQPSFAIFSHVMELGHSPFPPHAWRWSYEHAFAKIGERPADRNLVLDWGERWNRPGSLCD
jgi:hypothetical protein